VLDGTNWIDECTPQPSCPAGYGGAYYLNGINWVDGCVALPTNCPGGYSASFSGNVPNVVGVCITPYNQVIFNMQVYEEPPIEGESYYGVAIDESSNYGNGQCTPGQEYVPEAGGNTINNTFVPSNIYYEGNSLTGSEPAGFLSLANAIYNDGPYYCEAYNTGGLQNLVLRNGYGTIIYTVPANIDVFGFGLEGGLYSATDPAEPSISVCDAILSPQCIKNLYNRGSANGYLNPNSTRGVNETTSWSLGTSAKQ
jgi:hypothetical protein